MFSEPGEDQPSPADGQMGAEARLDDVTPTDDSPTSQSRADLVKDEAIIPVSFTISTDNVASPPTDAELTAAFGAREKGAAFIVIDGGGSGAVWLVVKGGQDTWWYEALTQAV
jgi:hypothetical protein